MHSGNAGRMHQPHDMDYSGLQAVQRNQMSTAHWSKFPGSVMYDSATASTPVSLVPQKRAAAYARHLGSEPPSKRAVPAASTSPLSASNLERHYSAPAGPISAVPTRPIDIPATGHQLSRRQSVPTASHSNRPFQSCHLRVINEIHAQDLSPSDYITHPMGNTAQSMSLDFALAAQDSGHYGAWLTSNPYQFPTQHFGADDSYSPVTAISDSYLTPASIAPSAPMTRCNTNELICEPFGLFNMDPAAGSYPTNFVARGPHSSLSAVSPVVPFHFSALHDDIKTAPKSVAMKPSLSMRSEDSSTESVSSSQSSFSTSATMTNVPSCKPRPIAPKQENEASNRAAAPKFVTVKEADGTLKQKAEIARAARPVPQRKTTFCNFCKDHPNGFHGDHELRRHIERQHTQYRKVWICQDISVGGTFLRNCKACRNKKTYGANYNAAAHLRRAHFNPCKNKRGGRGKPSEKRGGMGGGNKPTMDELKKWMYEGYEMNMGGHSIVQIIAQDAEIPPPSLLDFSAFEQSCMLVDSFDGADGIISDVPHDGSLSDSNTFMSPTAHTWSSAAPGLMQAEVHENFLPGAHLSQPLTTMPYPLIYDDIDGYSH